MSDFYKKMKTKILSEYNGIETIERNFYYVALVAAIAALIWFLVNFSRQNEVKPLTETALIVPLITLVVLIILFFCLSKKHSRRDKENRNTALNDIVKDSDINCDTAAILITEIENSLSKTNSFAKWVAGIMATILTVIMTLMADSLIKTIDLFLAGASANVSESFIEFVETDLITIMINNFIYLGGTVLCIVSVTVFIVYMIFSIHSFTKKKLLVFLYDVQYKLQIERHLIEDEQRAKEIDINKLANIQTHKQQ